jgi:hypothetical protein
MEIKNEDLKIELRTLTKDDYIGLKASMIEAYSDWEGASFWGESILVNWLKYFPKGRFVCC